MGINYLPKKETRFTYFRGLSLALHILSTYIGIRSYARVCVWLLVSIQHNKTYTIEIPARHACVTATALPQISIVFFGIIFLLFFFLLMLIQYIDADRTGSRCRVQVRTGEFFGNDHRRRCWPPSSPFALHTTIFTPYGLFALRWAAVVAPHAAHFFVSRRRARRAFLNLRR